MRYYPTPIMTIITKSTNSKCWTGCGGKGTPPLCYQKATWCRHYGFCWKLTVWSFLKKLELELLYDPANPFLGIYLEKKTMKALIWKHTCANSSTIYNNRDMEATQVPTNRWMDKEIVVHIYSGIVHTHILHIHMYIIYTYICCSPWSRKGSGTTEWLAWTELKQKRWEHEKKTR